jgi:hypothetical protein
MKIYMVLLRADLVDEMVALMGSVMGCSARSNME